MIKQIIFFMCVLYISHGAPLPLKIVDMTHVVDENAQRYPIFRNFSMISVMNHGSSRLGSVSFQSEEYASTTHAGTHMDAPSHFIVGGINIDQIPLEHFIAPAAVIDITDKAQEDPNAGITVEDLVDWENKTGRTLDGTIVLQRSGWHTRYRNNTAYLGNAEGDTSRLVFPGFEGEAAQWLVDNRKIKGVGVDTMSFDKGSDMEFPSHKIILGKGLFGLENVANVDKIPISGATLHVMPMKMAHASGAPTRVVATFPEVIFSV